MRRRLQSTAAGIGALLACSACASLGSPLSHASAASRQVAAPIATSVGRLRGGRTLPGNLRGITFDDLSTTCSATPAQLRTVRALSHPTIRVVFDPVPPTCYARGVSALDRYGFTMGELIDSSVMRDYSLTQVRTRTRRYLALLGGRVDLWEIGNEANGEWLSSVRCPRLSECPARARDVMTKVETMYAAVSTAGYATALTLYYEPPQTVTRGYAMIPWEERYIPPAMHAGLDYVLVSYYEGDNASIRPSQAQWARIFAQLAHDFPHAKVGFGEIGLDRPIRAATLSRARGIFAYYQSLRFPTVPSYTRAGFWWNAAEDLVPLTKWPTFFREAQAKL